MLEKRKGKKSVCNKRESWLQLEVGDRFLVSLSAVCKSYSVCTVLFSVD
jgi:hypothetical protein